MENLKKEAELNLIAAILEKREVGVFITNIVSEAQAVEAIEFLMERFNIESVNPNETGEEPGEHFEDEDAEDIEDVLLLEAITSRIERAFRNHGK